MLFKSFAAVSLMAASAMADFAGIRNSLVKIDQDIAAQNKSLLAYDGNILLAIPLLGASNTLNNDLDAGTKTAKASAELTVDEAVALVPYVQQLSSDADITIKTAIEKAPIFKKNGLNGITQAILKDTKTKAQAFGAAVVAKVPESLRPTAQSLVDPLIANFDKAIAAFA